MLDEMERGGEKLSSKNLLNDDDYTYENRNYRRLKDYSFTRS